MDILIIIGTAIGILIAIALFNFLMYIIFESAASPYIIGTIMILSLLTALFLSAYGIAAELKWIEPFLEI